MPGTGFVQRLARTRFPKAVSLRHKPEPFERDPPRAPR